jgi:hypothetical protein
LSGNSVTTRIKNWYSTFGNRSSATVTFPLPLSLIGNLTSNRYRLPVTVTTLPEPLLPSRNRYYYFYITCVAHCSLSLLLLLLRLEILKASQRLVTLPDCAPELYRPQVIVKYSYSPFLSPLSIPSSSVGSIPRKELNCVCHIISRPPLDYNLQMYSQVQRIATRSRARLQPEGSVPPFVADPNPAPHFEDQGVTGERISPSQTSHKAGSNHGQEHRPSEQSERLPSRECSHSFPAGIPAEEDPSPSDNSSSSSSSYHGSRHLSIPEVNDPRHYPPP